MAVPPVFGIFCIHDNKPAPGAQGGRPGKKKGFLFFEQDFGKCDRICDRDMVSYDHESQAHTDSTEVTGMG